MSDIRFYIPKDETIPTDLRLYVDDEYVVYCRIFNGFRFCVLLEDEEAAMKVVEKVVARIKQEQEEPEHGVTWVTISLAVVPQNERYRTVTIIDWTYREIHIKGNKNE